MAEHHSRSVKFTGAKCGDCLIGARPLNQELIIKIDNDQEIDGKGGRVLGSFKLLHAGNGDNCQQLEKMVGRNFDSASELVEEVRAISGASKVTHILNRGELVSLRYMMDNITRS